MSALHTNNKFELRSLQSSIKKSGFARWRYIFNAKNNFTGEKSAFFIELYLVNPSLSPNEVIWSDPQEVPVFKDESQLFIPQEETSPHSYVSVRIGKYGTRPEIIQSFLPAASFSLTNKTIEVSDGVFCLDGDKLTGTLSERGKYVSWRLKIEKIMQFVPGKMKKNMYWGSPAVKAFFSGDLLFSGETYIVEPGISFGYIDKLWGKDYPYPFFHLSCSHMSSIISGKILGSSVFAVQGIYKNSFAMYAEIDGVKLARSRVKNNPNFGCVVMDNKVHWTISVPLRQYLIDIDVFCSTREMSVRSYICPSNPKEELQVLGGASGVGEMKLYRRIKKKNLELVESVSLQDVRCEYGGREQSDNE